MARSAFVQGPQQKNERCARIQMSAMAPEHYSSENCAALRTASAASNAEQMISDYPSDNSGRPRSEPPEKPLWGSRGSFESLLARNVPEQ